MDQYFDDEYRFNEWIAEKEKAAARQALEEQAELEFLIEVAKGERIFNLTNTYPF